MLISVSINPDEMKMFKVFASEYIELKKVGNKCYLISDNSDGYFFLKTDVLNGATEKDFHIRIESVYFKNITKERKISIGLTVSNVTLNFYDENDKFIYSYEVQRYLGIASVENFLSLISKKDDYEKFNIKLMLPMITLASNLNTKIYSHGDGFISCEVNGSYAYHDTKINIPRFSIPANTLLKAVRLNEVVYFIQDYIYLCNGNFNLFLYKYRVDCFNIKQWLSTKKMSFILNIDLKTANRFIGSINTDESDNFILSFKNKEIIIKNDKRTVKLVIDDIIKKEKSLNVSFENLLENINNGNTVESKVLSDIKIPRWVFKYVVNFDKLVIGISTNFVIISSKNRKVIIPRKDY